MAKEFSALQEMIESNDAQGSRPEVPRSHGGLGLSLLVVATAQLMLVLDDTVANIALPSIQRELAVSAAALPWIISAYVLTFGSLLLFGGRAGDVLAVDARPAGSSYSGHVLPALFLTYFGLGLGFMPMTLIAVHGVASEQTGIASALLNTAQQIGAALGVAVLSTVATTASDERLPQATRALQQALAGGDGATMTAARDALTYGYTSGFVAGTAMLTIAAVIVGVAVNTRRTQSTAPTPNER